MNGKEVDEKACAEFAKILAEATEEDCFRFMSYITMRLDYLHGKEVLRKCGCCDN